MAFDRQSLRNAKYAVALLKQDLKQVYRKIVWKGAPTTLNLLVNDVCNSKCQMCLIWKNKAGLEFDPDELNKILSDDLFKKLEYIGVSGGEPTLRKDLPDIFEVLCQKRPRLKGIGIITNGILYDVVKERILNCADICRKNNISFNVMISLDGLNEIHDAVSLHLL